MALASVPFSNAWPRPAVRVRQPLASDLISYGLAHKLRQKYATISNFVQCTNDTTGNARLAVDALAELSKDLERYIESVEDEKARARRDESK